MGRAYAGVLGPLAFVTLVARGLLHSRGPESTLQAGLIGLVCFSLIGTVIGELAGWIVRDSVQATAAAEITEQQTAASGLKTQLKTG